MSDDLHSSISEWKEMMYWEDDRVMVAIPHSPDGKKFLWRKVEFLIDIYGGWEEAEIFETDNGYSTRSEIREWLKRVYRGCNSEE